MNLSAWFSYQLKASIEGFVWAVDQVPPERHTILPPKAFGEWTLARHIFHMLYYERTLALPHMRHWLGDPLPSFDDRNEEEAWQAAHSEIVSYFRHDGSSGASLVSMRWLAESLMKASLASGKPS